MMEIRKMFFDGITYNVFTDQELEDYKEYILLEKKANDIKNGLFKGMEADDFLKNLDEHDL